MMKIKFSLDIGLVGAEQEEIFDFCDDTSDECIEECLNDWAWDLISKSWERLSDVDELSDDD